ncbi:hypothetical protein FQV11_0000018, partial [Eudyptes moseleyi]
GGGWGGKGRGRGSEGACPDLAPPPQPFQKVPGVTLVPAALSEAAKGGGALSSCCLLL